MASGGGSGNSGSRSLVLAWDVPPDQEEPGASCRSFRVLGMKRTPNRGDAWVL